MIEENSSPEGHLERYEDKKYQEFLEAQQEVGRITMEIGEVLTTEPDREKAEKIILEKFASRMDEAIKRQDEAQKKWIASMQNQSGN